MDGLHIKYPPVGETCKNIRTRSLRNQLKGKVINTAIFIAGLQAAEISPLCLLWQLLMFSLRLGGFARDWFPRRLCAKMVFK
jgi:hypothetical protein